MSTKSYFTWAQTFFPWSRSLKFGAFNYATREFGKCMDRDFSALGRLGPVDLALDIGANWGQSIEAFARCSRPKKIMAFEPNQELAGRLRRTYADDPSVEVAGYGLSDSAGSMELFIPRYRNFVFDGLASLDEAEAREWLSARSMKFYRSDLVSVDCQKVELRTVDSLGVSPDLVKIDVQGAEEAVVRAGMETFRRCRPVMIIENPPEGVVKLLGEIGLKPYLFDGHSFRSYDWTYKNAIFATDEKLAAMQGAQPLPASTGAQVSGLSGTRAA